MIGQRVGSFQEFAAHKVFGDTVRELFAHLVGLSQVGKHFHLEPDVADEKNSDARRDLLQERRDKLIERDEVVAVDVEHTVVLRCLR